MLIKIINTVTNYEEAVRISCEILEEKGIVEKRYYKSILDKVKELGPYFCISEGVCMPYARLEDGVIKEGVCILKLNNPINFHGKLINVFFILAANNNEIVPAFKGISSKLVPNSKPTLDCLIVFPYAQNAVLIGFIFSFLGGVVSMLLLGVMELVIIIPGVVGHFFTGATAVFGNATGGRRGAMVGSFVNGIMILFLPVALLLFIGNLGIANSTFSDADFAVVSVFIGKV